MPATGGDYNFRLRRIAYLSSVAPCIWWTTQSACLRIHLCIPKRRSTDASPTTRPAPWCRWTRTGMCSPTVMRKRGFVPLSRLAGNCHCDAGFRSHDGQRCMNVTDAKHLSMYLQRLVQYQGQLFADSRLHNKDIISRSRYKRECNLSVCANRRRAR